MTASWGEELSYAHRNLTSVNFQSDTVCTVSLARKPAEQGDTIAVVMEY